MAASLKPCASCSRHVRTSERACPFCGERLELFEGLSELRLLSRLDRNTMVRLGAVLSAAGIVLGCRETPTPIAIYGAPAPPSEVQEPTAPPGSASPLEPLPPDAPPAEKPPSEKPPLAPAPPAAPTASAAPGFPPAAAYGAPPSMSPGIAPAPAPTPPAPAPRK